MTTSTTTAAKRRLANAAANEVSSVPAPRPTSGSPYATPGESITPAEYLAQTGGDRGKSGGGGWIAPLVGGVLGGLGSWFGAKEANKPKNTLTDQTTTQNPFRSDLIGPDIEAALNYQRGLVARGAPRVDAHGNIYYDPLPGVPPTAAGPGGGMQNAGTPGSAAGTHISGQGGRYNAKGVWVPASGSGGSSPAPGASAAGPDFSTPQGIFGEVARRGLETGNTATQAQARNVMGNIWGSAANPTGQGASDGTGFEGYNPILDRLAGTLEGDVGDRVGRDLILKFLGENGRGVGGNAGAGGAGGGSGSPIGAAATQAILRNRVSPIGGGSVPDTMAADSFFGTQTRKIFDEQANNAELQALIDSMNQDTERGMFRDLAQLDAASTGAGRFGGSTWAAQNRDAREEALQEMNKTTAGVRVGDREARRQAQLSALQGVNARDLGLLNANVQREGINASASSAASGQADQLALARRAQDLSAIGQLMDTEQFSLGQLGNVGGQLSSDRLGALGMVPGLEGIGLAGLNATLGAGGGMVDIRGQDIQRQIAGQQAGLARAGMNQQLGMYNAGQGQGLVNDYLRTVMGIGGMGGTSHTVGTNVQPGLGVSPTGAALMGGLGGAATGAGLYGTYRGY